MRSLARPSVHHHRGPHIAINQEAPHAMKFDITFRDGGTTPLIIEADRFGLRDDNFFHFASGNEDTHVLAVRADEVLWVRRVNDTDAAGPFANGAAA